ncbi:MAG: AAA family ATPase [Kiritimatiellae bacterium]|nr:AAA family ATPase [Kiritimatiellia bacterium]
MMVALNSHKQLVLALLRGSSEPMSISDVWRGLQNRAVDISYTEFEDWLLDQTDYLRINLDGRVTVRPGQDMGNIRPVRVVPDQYDEGTDTDASTRLHRLLAYYKDCLLEEGKAIASYREQEGSSFVVLSEELLSTGRSFASIRTSDMPDFVKNVAGGTRTAYYGYPLMLEWVETGDGEFADYKAIPVFIVRLEIQQEPARCLFHVDTKSVRLNPLVLARSKWRDRAFVRSRLDAETDQYSSFGERLEMIGAVLPDADIREDLAPSLIIRAKSLENVPPDKAGLYNRSGIFLGGSNPYILGLIRDIEELLTKSQGHFEQTALAPLLRTKSANAEQGFAHPGRIRVLSPGDRDSLLNAPQEMAVAQAFSNRLSVITGPPGTGKSQVVTSIITTAVLHDKTVLFASRNNKALEVVQERIKKTCPDAHTLVRVGGSYDDECSELLQRMGNLPPRGGAVPFQNQMQSIDLHLSELDDLNDELDRIGTVLARAGLAQDRFDTLKKKLLPGNPKAYEAARQFDPEALLLFAKRLEASLNVIAGMPNFLATLWVRLQSQRGRTEAAALNNALKKAGISFSASWPSNVPQLQATFRALFPLVDLCQAANEMEKTAGALGTASQLEALFESILEHKTAIAKKVAALLTAKVRENASGRDMPESTQEAVQHYRETMPQLRGKKLNDEQRQVRLESLGRVFPDMLRRLPAWAVTNLSVSHRVPLEPGIFDLVVIDEASQCDIPSCLPLLYRAKQAVVIGDPLQLPQITQIARNVEDQFLRSHGLNGPENDHLRYSDKSMFDAAQSVTPRAGSQFLASHYRCHPDIINFANSSQWWYDDRLEVFTDTQKLKRPEFWKRGITWIQVSSHAVPSSKGYHLPEEVSQTISIIRELLEDRKYEGTVGVVCPLRGMVDLIRDGIEKAVDGRLLQLAAFEAQTAHGFQGDERDVIVYTMAVHSGMPRGARWFIAENRNLFNVALSRARAAFVVVGDKEAVRQFTFEDKPVEYLRQFVEYVDSLSDVRGPAEGEPTFLPEQLWEERFYSNALRPAGISVYAQYPLGPYKLDFAVLRENKTRKLDIEIDGEAFHKDDAGKRLRRDIDRDIYVKAQGGGSWDVMRFWVYELREDMESCLKKVQQWINSAP